MMYKFLVLIITGVAIISCSQDMAPDDLTPAESIDELNQIIDDCRNNEFTDETDIEANLIGEWKLLGIKSGWLNNFSH